MTMVWSGCANARDLGGAPTVDGARIRDLRWARECAADPSPFAGEPFYRHVPLLADPMGYDPPEHTYGPLLDHNPTRIADAFREIASAPPGTVVVHCHGGRDRTGA